MFGALIVLTVSSTIYILFDFHNVFGALIVLTVSSNVYILFGFYKVFGALIVLIVSCHVYILFVHYNNYYAMLRRSSHMYALVKDAPTAIIYVEAIIAIKFTTTQKKHKVKGSNLFTRSLKRYMMS